MRSNALGENELFMLLDLMGTQSAESSTQHYSVLQSYYIVYMKNMNQQTHFQLLNLNGRIYFVVVFTAWSNHGLP